MDSMKSLRLGSLLTLMPLTLSAAPADDGRLAIAELDKAESYSWVITSRDHSYYSDEMRLVQVVGHKLPGGTNNSTGPVLWPFKVADPVAGTIDRETLVRYPAYELVLTPTGGAVRLFDNSRIQYSIEGPSGGLLIAAANERLPSLTNSIWESIEELATTPELSNRRFREQFPQSIRRWKTPSVRAAELLQRLDRVDLVDGLYSGRLSITAIKDFLASEGIVVDGPTAVADLSGTVGFRLLEGRLAELRYNIRGIYLHSRSPGVATVRTSIPERISALATKASDLFAGAVQSPTIGMSDQFDDTADFVLAETVAIGSIGSAKLSLPASALAKAALPFPAGWSLSIPSKQPPPAPTTAPVRTIQPLDGAIAINSSEEVRAAIKELSNAPNYSWRILNNGGVPVRSTTSVRVSSPSGKVAKPAFLQFNGVASATGVGGRRGGPGLAAGLPPRPSSLFYEVILDGDAGFYRPSAAAGPAANQWQALESLAQGDPASPENDLFLKEFVREVKLSPSPVAAVASLVDKSPLQKTTEGLFQAEIPGAALLEFLDSINAVFNPTQAIDGRIRVWVEDGFLRKFDITINGRPQPPGAAQPPVGQVQEWKFYRVIEFFDIGATKIEKPNLSPSPAL